MWTDPAFRQQGCASSLLDVIRENFVYNHVVPRGECAFSQPTPLGMQFAERFTGKASFLVYMYV